MAEDPQSPLSESERQSELSLKARINLPINLEAWRDRSQEEQDALLWFHQHLLDNRMSWDQAKEALGMDGSTIWRLIKGVYEAKSWAGPIGAIKSYRRICEQRATIKAQVFAETPVTKLIFAGLDYALANNSVTMIIGESRQGKTVSAEAWAASNNHGRSVLVTAPVIGGVKMLMQVIADKVGVNKNLSQFRLIEAIYRAFNGNRILIVDEAHRLLPADPRALNPACIEVLRDIHDQTHCGLALVATARLSDRLRSGAYQFEQLIGRIGMPVRLPVKLRDKEVLPILTQYLSTPSHDLVRQIVEIANEPGRLGIVTELLRVASRMAKKAKEELHEGHVEKAIALRRQMTGEAK